MYNNRAIFRRRFRVTENLPVPIKNNNIHGHHKRSFPPPRSRSFTTNVFFRLGSYKRRLLFNKSSDMESNNAHSTQPGAVFRPDKFT